MEQSLTPIFFVTQTFPPRVGGMENVMLALARGLAARGHKVHVCGDHAYDAAAENFTFTCTGGFKTWRALRKKNYMKASFRHNTAPLIICDSWKSVAAVPDITHNGGRLVILAHGQEYLKTGRRAERVARALARTDIFIANSEDTLARATPFLPSAGVAQHIIAPTYALPPNAPAISERDTENHAPLKLVSLCRLEARKGLAQTIAALAGMKAKLPDFTWQIAGTGPEAKNLQACITAQNLEVQVFLTGQVDLDEKTRLLSDADLFIMPSYQQGGSVEGFGISYIEAARFGVPALAGNSGGAREAVLNGETGWCVDTLNAGELGAALYEAMTDTHRRQLLGRQAQARYLAEFSGPSMLDRFVEACDLNS